MVFAWHFLHFNNGTPVPFGGEGGAPMLFPLALFDEGHTGVALFMVLSGYLFAKLLEGKNISYPAFFWNRFIRLTPLLLVTFVLVGIERHLRGLSAAEFFGDLHRGLVYPVWPNGGWSITTEIHFYIVLPFLLFLSRKSRMLPLAFVLAAIAFRAYYFKTNGEVQTMAYWTILGRIDQFILGIVAFSYRPQLVRHARLLLLVFALFVSFWWWFDTTGGFYLRPKYPSSSPLWIWISTIEGVAYAAIITWYDSRKINETSVVSRILQRLGEYSYSIYLLHVFIVFEAARYVHNNVMNISNFYLCLVWALALFVAMLLPGYLSFRFIESPFLRLRLKYIKQPEAARLVVARNGA